MTPDMRIDQHYLHHMPTDRPGAARLGKLIKQARIDRGWTQQNLADESGVSIETIKRYENAKTKYPDPVPVRNIVHALGIDVREVPVALGLVSREEMGLPHPPPRRHLSATTEQLIEALTNPAVSDEERQAILILLQARRNTRDNPSEPTSQRDAV